MSDLGWRAEGIARARAVGGVELETYRLPGFSGGIGVRRASDGGYVQGINSAYEPEGDPVLPVHTSDKTRRTER